MLSMRSIALISGGKLIDVTVFVFDACQPRGGRVEQVLVYGPLPRFCRDLLSFSWRYGRTDSAMSKKLSAEELIERARKLAPTLRERAKDADALRHVPKETIADFHELGLFKAVQPARYGGYEHDARIIYDLQLELGKGCASSAWVFGVLSVHIWQMALFPVEAQDEVWGENPDTL